MNELQVMGMIQRVIRKERERIVKAIRAVPLPTRGTVSGFVAQDGFEEFRDSIAEAIEGEDL